MSVVNTVSKVSSDIIKLTKKSLTLLKTDDEIVKHRIINQNIQLINQAIKNKIHDFNKNENIFRLENNLAVLKYYREQLKSLKLKNKVSGGGAIRSGKKYLVWQDVKSCFKNRVRSGIIVNVNLKEPKQFLKKAFRSFSIKVKQALKNSLIKVNVVFEGNFAKLNDGEVDLKSFGTKNKIIDQSIDLKRLWKDDIVQPILNKLESFENRNSGWTLLEIIGLRVNINNYTPITVGLSTYVEMPKFILNKHCVVNVKNNDPYCILWSIVAALYPNKRDSGRNSARTSSYPDFREVLKFDGIDFPITLKQIPKLERLNNLCINVYGIEKKEVLPVRLSKDSGGRVINLLMIPAKSVTDNSNDDDDEAVVYHFAWINNMSRLLSKQLSKHNCKQYICNRCLNHFSKQELLDEHFEYCNAKTNTCKVELPKEQDRFLKFKNYRYKERVPFAVYADFECILEPCSDENKLNLNTQNVQKHTAFSVAYYLKCSYDDSLSRFKLYRGTDCQEWFVRELEHISAEVNDILSRPKPIEPLSAAQQFEHNNAEICHVCEKPFTSSDIKTADHSHLTGNYRGPSHVSCNINYIDSHIIPVVFHCLSSYDGHLVIRQLATLFEGNITLLPINKDKYISFTKEVKDTKIKLRFIDSFRFMSDKIERLASYLDDCQKLITKAHCKSEEEFRLVTRKGIFPYDYLDSLDRLNDQKLPYKDAFYSKLTDEPISDSDYEHALNVWNKFNIENLGEYSDLYLKTDVLLLADIFENFREQCLHTYGLDPLHYYTSPGLAFDAMLKITKQTLQLLTDIDKVLMIEKGIRGGVAQVSNRYSKANNKYMGGAYNPNDPDKYLMYYDVNNLYGAAMSQPLATEGFEWVSTDQFYSLNIHNLPYDSEIGYILEVDIEYPPELHELHKDLPLCPEQMTPRQ